MPLISNSTAIIMLGVIVGAATNVSFVGSQAYLLSLLQPVYALYVSTVSGILFSLFLKKSDSYKGRFSSFSLLSTVLFVVVLVALNFLPVPQIVRAVLWFFLTVYGIGFFRWMMSEITIRYLDPARAQSQFAYLVTAYEVGILVTALFLKFYGKALSVNDMIWLSSALFIPLIALIAIQFCRQSNFEIRFTKKIITEPIIDKKLIGSFAVLFTFLTIVFGAYIVCEEYVVRVAIKETLISYGAISDMITNYLLVGSIVVIALGAFTGGLMKSRHISPIRLLGANVFVSLVFAVVCLVTRSLLFFVAFEVVKKALERCLYTLSNQMIISSFIGTLRNRMRAIQSFYYYAFITVPFAVIFSIPAINASRYQKEFILSGILVFLLIAVFLVFKIRQRYMEIMYQFINSNNKTAAIIAAQALSFLKPSGFEDRLAKLLTISPKKLLRKNIILSLAYSGKDSVTEVITKEFASDQEEIQIAVLDALNISRNYKAVQFILDIVMATKQSKSLRIRINATSMIANIYGKKAIPFLLDGLRDPDDRVVANTLETLSSYKDKKLIPYFKEFMTSKVPRIRANALLGLSYFRQTRDIYRNEVTSILKDDNVNAIASILYVIGKRCDLFFKNFLFEIHGSGLKNDTRIKRVLAWALARTHDPRGFALFAEVLADPASETDDATMHFFLQMDRGMRFDLIKYLAITHGSDMGIVKNIGNKMRHSRYDFHEEIEYFNSVFGATAARAFI